MLLTVQLEPCLYCWMKGHLTVHCTNYLQDIMCFNTHPLKVGFLISNYQKCQACSKLRRRRRSGTKWRRIDDKPNNVCNIIGLGSTKWEFEPSTSFLSQSSWGGFYKELVKPYQEVVIGVRDGTHQGAIQTVSEVHKVEVVKLKDKCKVDFRIVNGG